MSLSSEVGLRLLLCPFGSNIVTRTACCSIGVVLPVYSTFRAIETKDQNEQQKWLLYWAVYGSFSVAEVYADKILSWFPLYYHVKFAFLVWLQLPSTNGAKQLYMSHLRPFLLRHQAKLDQIVDCFYCEMSKFIIAHQGEIQFARRLVMKIMLSANQMIRNVVHPVPRVKGRAIEGLSRQTQDSQSDNED
ncbi:TB2_DP1_HVA22 domain-containing protein [Cephalotus follicularis]|uniref:HVA22-like protein n=1 Tax=Cephalotus follicularis TaxID=3775 RepID=A0A1Q3C9M5_CEPFO|nr:TB2_DP1_HVA22 domain-containing protein [Cephalotus follicularis]